MTELQATSARVARQLWEMGFEATALKGGLAAWRDLYPVEQVAA